MHGIIDGINIKFAGTAYNKIIFVIRFPLAFGSIHLGEGVSGW